MVNSPLKIQPLPSPSWKGSRPPPGTGQPVARGGPAPRGIPRGGEVAPREERGVWPREAGASAAAPPSGPKEERRSPSQRSGDKGPAPESAAEAGRRSRRGGAERTAAGRRRPPPRPQGTAAAVHRWAPAPLGLVPAPQTFRLGAWAKATLLPSPPGVQELIPGPRPTFCKGKRTSALFGTLATPAAQRGSPPSARQ